MSTERTRQRRERCRDFANASRRTNSELIRDPKRKDPEKWFSIGPNQIEQVDRSEGILREVIQNCESFARLNFDVPNNFKIHPKFDWRSLRARSRGGKYSGIWLSREQLRPVPDWNAPGISLRMIPEFDGVRERTEYSTLSPFGDIGTMTVSHRDFISLTAIHECSHSIQHSASIPEDIPEVKAAITPHGIWFCDIYSKLRRHFGLINVELPMYHTLPLEQKVRLHGIRNMPADIIQFLKDPAEFRKQQKLESQKRKRSEAKKSSPEIV